MVNALARYIGLSVLLLPLVEIALFIVVGKALGVWLTLLGVVLSTVAGLLVLRWLGFAMLGDIRTQMNRRQLPGQAAADAMMMGVAAMLLIVPGYFTSAIGLLLLLPPVRGLIYGWFSRHVQVVDLTASEYGYARRPEIGDDTIELDNDEWRPR